METDITTADPVYEIVRAPVLLGSKPPGTGRVRGAAFVVTRLESCTCPNGKAGTRATLAMEFDLRGSFPARIVPSPSNK